MHALVEINNKTQYASDTETITRIVEKTIELSGIACLADKNVEVSIACVGQQEIQSINTQYRKIDKPTDILSFSEYEDTRALCEETRNGVALGELIVCPEFIEMSAQENGVTFEDETAYIVSHGVLHLLGFEHGEKMFAIQQRVARHMTHNTYAQQ